MLQKAGGSKIKFTQKKCPGTNRAFFLNHFKEIIFPIQQGFLSIASVTAAGWH